MTLFTGILISIQVFYWYLIFGAILSYKKRKRQQGDFPITTIICAKNELPNLKSNLPYIMQQSQVANQIIIANDFSTDGTSQYIAEIDNMKWPVKCYEVKQNKHGKKQALSEALVVSDTDFVLLTDADCRPESNLWAQSMVEKVHNEDIKLVLGYGPLRHDRRLLSKWCHFEAWLVAVQYLSYAAKGLPYMGVGRNMLYDKTSLPDEALRKYSHLASGDDDLTIMQMATKENTAINLDKDSYVYSDAPMSFVAYWRQKIRHYSTASSYKGIHKVLLGIYSISQILLYVAFLGLVILGKWQWAVLFAGIRWVILMPQVYRFKKLLAANFSLWMFPVYDLIQSLSYVLFSFAVLIPQKNRW